MSTVTTECDVLGVTRSPCWSDLRGVVEAAERLSTLAAAYVADRQHPSCACEFCNSRAADEGDIIANGVRSLAHVSELIANDLNCVGGFRALRSAGVTID